MSDAVRVEVGASIDKDGINLVVARTHTSETIKLKRGEVKVILREGMTLIVRRLEDGTVRFGTADNQGKLLGLGEF